MKICIISHSNIAPRQQMFWKYFSKYAEVLVITPNKWRNLKATNIHEDNYSVFPSPYIGNSMHNFFFDNRVFWIIKKFKPDIIYNQNDVNCVQTQVSYAWAKQLNCKFIEFVWENLKKPSITELNFLKNCDLIVAGNLKAKKLHKGDVVITQVGIDTNLFKQNKKIIKNIDVLFVGRDAREKGVEVYHHLSNTFKTKWAKGVTYFDMVKIYNKSKILIVPSLDTDFWMEQGPACISESLAAQTPIVAFDSGSIKENYDNSGGIRFIKQGDIKNFKKAVSNIIFNDNIREKMGIKGRKFIEENYSFEAVSQKLLKSFNKVLK